MSFEFKCPKCNHLISERDFNENDKIMNHLNEIFRKHENDYIKKLKTELNERYKAELAKELKRSAAEKENELIKIHQKQVDQLNEKIAEQKMIVSNKDSDLSKALIAKENQLIKEKQEELDKLKEIIAEKQNEITNNKTLLEKALVEHELQINKANAELVTELKTKIKELETANDAQKLMLEKTFANKENELTKSNQSELSKLQQIISEQKNKIDNGQLMFDKQILEEKEAIFSKTNAEIKTLNQKINELEKANTQYRVIQNKTKGENFEHEIEAELRKVFEPDDVISKITSVDKKADYLQQVRQDNTIIGKIVYEVKNAEWSNNWEKKLLDDMAKQDSKYGILVATSFNNKYLGIPFKRSDYNPNIYLCDSESFYFVGQILRTLIKIEYRLESNRSQKDYNEKIKVFNSWKEIQLPKLSRIIETSCSDIQNSEKSILSNLKKITSAREKIYKNWFEDIKDYLESFIF